MILLASRGSPRDQRPRLGLSPAFGDESPRLDRRNVPSRDPSDFAPRTRGPEDGSQRARFLRNEPGGKIGKPWTWRVGEDLGERAFCETNPAVSWANLGASVLERILASAFSTRLMLGSGVVIYAPEGLR